MRNYPLFILAGNATQASTWVTAKEIPIRNVRYVSNSHQLRGLTDPEFVVIGTFWERHDAKEIWECLMAGMMVGEPLIPVKWIPKTPQAAAVAQNQLHGSNTVPQTIPIAPKTKPKKEVKLDEDGVPVHETLPKHIEPEKKTFKKIQA